MALAQTEINEVMTQLQLIIAKALSESTSIQQAQANIQQGVTQYVGARYVPLFADPIEWDNTRAYEPLTIVLHQGNSYTTRQYTPAGIDIENDAFWACTGNYNAQIELYRQEVKEYEKYLGSIAKVYSTVAEMALDDLHVNKLYVTRGYRNAYDGGGALYEIVDNVAPNGMDCISVKNNLVAKLVMGNVIHPEQFGAYGDGATVDNQYINRCFEVGADKHIKGYDYKVYVVDASTYKTVNGITRYGLICNNGRYVTNMHFKLGTNVFAQTSLINCILGSNNYRFKNCTFETRKLNIVSQPADGGIHGLRFMNDTFTDPTDWIECGDIDIINCNFESIWSYGIALSPMNAHLLVENCNFNNSYGPGVTTYATNAEIRNCCYHGIVESDRSMIHSLAHDEMQIDSIGVSFTDIPKNITVENCHSNYSVYRIQGNTQYSVKYGVVRISNCSSSNEGDYAFVSFYSPDEKFHADLVEIDNCLTSSYIGVTRMDASSVIQLNCSKIHHVSLEFIPATIKISDSEIENSIRFNGEVSTLILDTVHFVNSTDYYGAISGRDHSGSSLKYLAASNIIFDGNTIFFVRALSVDIIDINGITRTDKTSDFIIKSSSADEAPIIYSVRGFITKATQTLGTSLFSNANCPIYLSGFAPTRTLTNCPNVINEIKYA